MKVYILFSEKLQRYYVGMTSDIALRLTKHNAGSSTYTKKGIPWDLVQTFDCDTKDEAISLEKRIKKRGAKRFLKDFNAEWTQSL